MTVSQTIDTRRCVIERIAVVCMSLFAPNMLVHVDVVMGISKRM